MTDQSVSSDSAQQTEVTETQDERRRREFEKEARELVWRLRVQADARRAVSARRR